MTRLDLPELAARLTLVAAGGRRAPRRRLLERHGSARAALVAGPMAWRAAGMREDSCIRLRNGADPDVWLRTAEWIQSPDHHVIAWHEDAYPPALRTLSGAPLLLFAAGNIALLQEPSIAIVGTRAPSTNGRDCAFALAGDFAAAGLVVVSGLASGIDGAAHAGCLAARGSTIAVVGTGPDVCYPAKHRELQTRILAEGGLIVSEHPPGTQALQAHFPSRNRIVAGIALATVVVEAAARSGALITARMAADAGREVFAMPGSLQAPQSRGCHQLIRDGARLLETASDALRVLAPELRRYCGAAMTEAADAAVTETSANSSGNAAGLGTTGTGATSAPSMAKRRNPSGPTTRQPTPVAANPAKAAAQLASHPAPRAVQTPAPASSTRSLRGRPDWTPDHNSLWSALGDDPTPMDVLLERTALTPARLSAILLEMELGGLVALQHGRYLRRAPA